MSPTFPHRTPAPSGRPEEGEFAPYAQTDIDYVAGNDAVAALIATLAQTMELLAPVDEDFASTFVYAPGKWTIKQVVGHLADDERIFAYRALCVARHDPRPLAGFDEKDYVPYGGFEERTLADLLEECRVVRQATLSFLSGLTPEAWRRRGMANGYPVSVRGLAFHVAGHELHHLRILRDKYLRPA
jgi:uncharacterized damage-inducible protein DinB